MAFEELGFQRPLAAAQAASARKFVKVALSDASVPITDKTSPFQIRLEHVRVSFLGVLSARQFVLAVLLPDRRTPVELTLRGPVSVQSAKVIDDVSPPSQTFEVRGDLSSWWSSLSILHLP